MASLDRLTKLVVAWIWTNVKISHVQPDQFVRTFQEVTRANVRVEFPVIHTKAAVFDQILLSAVMPNILAQKVKIVLLTH